MDLVKKPQRKFSDRVGRGLDALIGVFNPEAALRRFQMRQAGEMLASTLAFRGAQKNRFNKDWITSPGSADEDMLHSLPALRQRSRDLIRNDTHASGIMLTMKTNVVGIGIKPQSSLDIDQLKISAEEAAQIEGLCEQAFKRWTPMADAQGRMDFYDMQNLIEGQILTNGDVIVLEQRIYDEDFRHYSLAYQVIEADRLETPPEFSSDPTVRQGVKLGVRGQPIGYYISKCHPGDVQFRKHGFNEYTYYPLYNPVSGRLQVHHLYEVERPDQSRGLPILTPAIEYFHHKARYMEAEVIAARVAACLVGVVTKENPMENVLSRTTADEKGNRLEKMGVAKFEYLQPGEKLEVINPNRPSTAFEPFIKTVIRSISTSIGIPYELVAKDFSKSNYSAMRSALIEARRYFLKRQDWHQRKFLQPVYESVLEEAFLKGELGDIDFYERRHLWTATRWVAQGWPWVDPMKEVQASALAIEKGLTTGSREAALQGRDYYDTIDERFRELQYINTQSKKYGFDFFAANAAAQPAPAAPPKKDKPEDDENDDDTEDLEDEEN